MKEKKVFICQKCGHQVAKWVGKCPNCVSWNTIEEEVVSKASLSFDKEGRRDTQIVPLSKVSAEEGVRFSTGDLEFDAVLGGGIVLGSVLLLGGEPGVGKSTLSLQLALQNPQRTIFYISGEESMGQIKLRADRLQRPLSSRCFLISETDVQRVLRLVRKEKPELLIIDSIQTLYDPSLDSAPGSVSQVRHCAFELANFAKEKNCPILLVGHINKEGSLAGPKVLEHMVDVVLHFEGEVNHNFRLLRGVKNRFGSVAALGIFQMDEQGLKPVTNPSQVLMGRPTSSGSVVACVLEGIRPLLIETQALVSHAVYGTPQRSTTGFEGRRLSMILAVMEKQLHLKLGVRDVFVNITGGFQPKDTGLDLAVAVAILSSLQNLELPPKVSFCGELGLSGEIRPVLRIQERLHEAKKMGIETVFVSAFQKIKKIKGLHQVEMESIDQLPSVFL